MSVENRKRMYDSLVAKGKLHQDDGALVKEFGSPGAETTDTNFSAFTVKQLKEEATKQKLDFKEKATKDQLIVLLETASESPAPTETKGSVEDGEPEPTPPTEEAKEV